MGKRRTIRSVLAGLLIGLAGCDEEIVQQASAGRRIGEARTASAVDEVDPHEADNSCLSCHGGIEKIRRGPSEMFRSILEVAADSGTGNRCIVCHGGNPDTRAPVDLDPDSEAWKELADQAHTGTIPFFRDHPGPQDFYPDPGSPWINEHTCGPCHEWEVRVQWQSLMMTEAGKIQGTVWGFGGLTGYEHRWANYDVETLTGEDVVGTPVHREYLEALAAKEPQVFRDRMEQVPEAPLGGDDVRDDPSRSAFTYIRGECQRCHLAVGGKQRHGDFRGLGCSACHVPYGNAGRYEGQDSTLEEGVGRPLVHSIQAGVGAPVTAGEVTWSGIPVETCTTCHNRGRRIGVSYQGLMESEYAAPWTATGEGQPPLHGKHYVKLHADLHADKGFLCQDCHTTLDVHSSGRLIGAITAAVEVECPDCHGTPKRYPWELPLGWADEYEERPQEGEPRGTVAELPAFLAKADTPPPADGYLLTARGNPFGNVVRQGDRVHVHLASGAVHELSPLKTLVREERLSPAATVAMVRVEDHMQRMECYACHATWAPQCYGCHIKIDYRVEQASYDWVRIGEAHGPDGRTPEYTEAGAALRLDGEIAETRSYLRWEDPALAQNGEGRISPVIPGCQTTLTVIDEDGGTVLHNHIERIPDVEGAGAEGQRAIDHAPLHPHTVQKRARSCESCHDDPKALGHGIAGGTLWPDPTQDQVVDLMSGDGRVIPQQVAPQRSAIPNLAADWSRFVTETGEQLQTVGHHLRLSRPLDDDERAHIDREGVCLACHLEIPEESLAIGLLHHVADATGLLPRTNEEHSVVIHDALLLAAWVKILGIGGGGLAALVLVGWWRRRRRHGSAR